MRTKIGSLASCGAAESEGAPIRVASVPATSAPNPYVELFYAAMARFGVRLVGTFGATPAWLQANASRLEAVHIHWPEYLWRCRRDERFGRARGSYGLVEFLRCTHRLRTVVVWTVHNIEHHEGADTPDRLGYRLMGHCADLLVCHSEASKRESTRKWHPRGRVVTMPIGNYDGVFPPAAPGPEVLRQLRLDPRLPTVCAIGSIRPYKGLDVALNAARVLHEEVQLVVAGKPLDDFAITPLLKIADEAPTIRFIARRLSAQEFANILGASDAVLLPYKKITSSAAFMSAMTLGRGVIASDLPLFRELLADRPDAGRLFQTGNPRDLARAIREYLAVPRERRFGAARRIADEYPWEKVVGPVAAALKQCVLAKGKTART